MGKNFNVSPYFDDYNKLKGFLKILFRPEFAVQAREATQMQSILQNQISSLTDYFFDEGSQVLNGQTSIDLDYPYVKIQNTGSNLTLGSPVPATQMQKFIGTYTLVATGLTSGVVAEIVQVVDAEDNDPITYYVKYRNSGTSGTQKTFANGELIDVEVLDSNGAPVYTFTSTLVATDACGFGSSVSIASGTRYIQGFLVNVDQQTLVLDKYSNTPTANIGIRVIEDIVTSTDDATLLDNAQGSPNYAADGAHRYRIRLILDKSNDDVENFIRILSMKDGKIQEDFRQAQLQSPGIEKELAKRMYDHAGNFIVEQFIVELREHLQETVDGVSNRGKFTAGEGGDESKFVMDVGAGRGYVSGYEIKCTGGQYVELNKSRQTDSYNNAVVGASYGAYVLVNNVDGVPDFNKMNKVNLRDIGNVIIGTARVRNMEMYNPAFTSEIATTSAQYKMYLFDIQFTGTSVFGDVRTINGTGINGMSFTAKPVLYGVNPNDYAVLEDRNNSMIIEQLPFTVVSSFVDVSYNVRQYLLLPSFVNGTVIPVPSNNLTFEAVSNGNYMLVNQTNGDVYDIYGGGDIVLSGDRKSLTLTAPAAAVGEDLIFIYTVNKNDATADRKTKTLNLSITDSFSSPFTFPLTLQKADIVRLNYIKDQSNNIITDKFILDNGQRDGYYGLGSIQLRPGQSLAGVTQLNVNYQYYQHSSGDYCTSESYPNFEEIPEYTSSFGDVIKLRDSVDFRPVITTASPTNLKFVFLPNDSIRGDVTYYLSRRDKVGVDELGNFFVIEGAPALRPITPETPKQGMMLFDLNIPAYTFNMSDIELEYIDHKRFTMKDIASLENRINKLEYYTSLSFLESSVNQKQFDDGDGERFKNGFVVDPFIGTNVGDVQNQDYECAIDVNEQECRPQGSSESVGLEYIEDESQNSVVTGNLLTLPYTEVDLAKQQLASRTENVNPFAVFNWEGTLELTPESSPWVDMYNLPGITVNRDGINSGWLYFGRGKHARRAFASFWSWWTANWAGKANATLHGRHGKVGIRFTAIDKVTQFVGDRLVDITMVPYMKSQLIQFKAVNMKPDTVVYPFFDGVSVGAYCKPDGGSFGAALKTDSRGRLTGYFQIPSNDTLRFKTGSRELRLIDTTDNDENTSSTIATGIFEARGVLGNREDSLVSTRVPRRIIRRIGQVRRLITTSLNAGAQSPRFNWADPLAESFLIKEEGGCFITGVGVYFKTKDSEIPVTLEIREMVNGYPGQRKFPFGEVTLQPEDVEVSTDGSVETVFQFQSPVYLQEDTEYCFVLLANSQKYNVFVARMGERDILTQELITKQPYAGVMFKSQNASTWTAEQTQDIKFSIYKAQFDINATCTAIFKNVDVEMVLLDERAFYTTNGSSSVKVNQIDHGMHIGSFVEFSGEVDPLTGVQSVVDPISNIALTASVWEVTDVINCDIYVMQPLDAGATGVANATQQTGGSNIMATCDVPMDVIKINAESLTVAGTGISWQAKTTSGRSVNGDAATQEQYILGNWFDIETADDVNFGLPAKIASRLNETDQPNLNGERSLHLKATLSSTNANVSPVIDLGRVSVVAAGNRITYPTVLDSEEDFSVENVEEAAQARYMIKKVSLNNPAVGLKVLFDGHRPVGADFKVYVRVLGSDTEKPFETENWHEMNRQTYPVNNSERNDFSEYTFTVEGAALSTPVPEFSLFSVKVVMLGQNSATPPRFRDFRAVAFGT